jgi:DNA polymerase-3 subunit beta
MLIHSISLNKALSPLKGTIPSNPVLPILENLLFELKNDYFVITASDMRTQVSVRVECNDCGTDSFCVPAKTFIDTIGSLDEGLKIEIKENHIIIKGEKGKYKIATEDPQEYPMSQIANAQSIELDGLKMKEIIPSVVVTTSRDELKPAMNGVLLRNDKFVSTDANRLTAFNANTNSDVECVIPVNALKTLNSCIGGIDTINTKVSDSAIQFISGNVKILTRLIDEPFPKWEMIVPSEHEYKVTFNRVAMLKSLKRLSIFSNKVTNLIAINPIDTGLFLSSEDIDFNVEGQEELPATFEGKASIKFGIDARNFTEMLNVIDCEEVTISVLASQKPILIKTSNSDYTGIIMPVMLAV